MPDKVKRGLGLLVVAAIGYLIVFAAQGDDGMASGGAAAIIESIAGYSPPWASSAALCCSRGVYSATERPGVIRMKTLRPSAGRGVAGGAFSSFRSSSASSFA